MAPTTCWSSVCKLLHIILLTHRILRSFLEFWKIRTPLVWSLYRLRDHTLFVGHQLHRGNVQQQVYGTSSVFTYVGFSADGSGMHTVATTFFASAATAGGSTGRVAGDSSVKVPTNISNVIFLPWQGTRLVNYVQRHFDLRSYLCTPDSSQTVILSVYCLYSQLGPWQNVAAAISVCCHNLRSSYRSFTNGNHQSPYRKILNFLTNNISNTFCTYINNINNVPKYKTSYSWM